MDRRTFIKLTAISGTSATIAACNVPENQIIRFLPDEETVPGIAEWKPSVCPHCGGGCGVNVRVMAADVDTIKNGQAGIVRMNVAKKLEGLEAHPVNQGGLCARGQAGIQVTYHPDRITQPLKRGGTRGDGNFQPISWDDAIKELVGKLDALASAGDGKSLSIVTGQHASHRRNLVDWFASRFGAPAAVGYELFGDDVLRRANAMSFGQNQLPTFDLKNARFVIGFGADFLGTWGSVVSQSMGYGHLRQGRPGIRGAFAQVESRMTTTGASADHWVPVPSGTEGVLALGLAHVILEHKLRPATNGRASALIDGWSTGLEEYSPENVEKITGVKHEKLERLAHEITEMLPAVAIVGGPALAHTNGLFTALAVNALNELLGAVGQPGGVHFTPQIPMAGPSFASRQTLDAWATAVNGGSQSAKVLMVDGANPVYSAPKAWKVKEALDKAGYIVSFASFVDETSVMADLILPDSSALESLAEALPESGSLTAVASVAPAAMKPLFTTRPTPDVLLDVAQKLAKPLELPWTSFEAMVKATFDTIGEDAWSTAQTQGGWWGELPKKAVPAGATAARSNEPKPTPVKYVAAAFTGDAAQYPYQFLPYASLQFHDGSLSHLPWLQELPDPTSSSMWGSFVELNPKTAAGLNIKLGDIVEVTSPVGTLKSPAFINPAIAPNVIAMPVGQGHTNFTRYATGRGQNPVELLAAVTEPQTGALAWAATRVKIARAGDPDGRMVLFSRRGELRELPHEGEAR